MTSKKFFKFLFISSQYKLRRYEKKNEHKVLLLYFYNNYLKEDAKWKDSIQYNKFINQSESNLFLRTNHACEGYNNRLRTQIKYSRTVIKKLIEEEAKY